MIQWDCLKEELYAYYEKPKCRWSLVLDKCKSIAKGSRFGTNFLGGHQSNYLLCVLKVKGTFGLANFNQSYNLAPPYKSHGKEGNLSIAYDLLLEKYAT